jgi:hypothetical protein
LIFSAFEVEIVIEKLNRHRSSYTDQIPAELIKAEGGTIRSETHKPISSKWNKEELPEEWKESIILSVYKKDSKRGCSKIIEAYLLRHIRKKIYSTS